MRRIFPVVFLGGIFIWLLIQWFMEAPEPALAAPTGVPTAPEQAEPMPVMIPAPAAPVVVDPIAEAVIQDDAQQNSGVINIGEPMDPDDPSTWPRDDNTEVINIGEPMDPDDPSTWPQDENTEVINIGEPMDPDDPSTWPRDDNTEVINIGEPMDPDDPYSWPQSDNPEVINIGEPMDPDDPYSGL